MEENYSQNKKGCCGWFLKIITAISVLAVIFILFNQRLIVEKYQEAMKNFLTARTKEMNLLGKLPEATGEKEITFDWNYKNKKYSLSEKFYASYYDFYANSAKGYRYVGDLDQNWKTKYFQRFIDGASGDDIIEKVADDILKQGQANHLSEDETAELTLAFVQSISYDETRGQAIINGDTSIVMQFPYETLYRQTGVCGDKSFLAARLIKDLGYGTALFEFEKEKHMALGIQCDSQYANYQSGYCYAETTNTGFKIGMIPDVDPKTSQSIALKKIGNFGTVASQFDTQKLSTPVLSNNTEGKTYALIGNTIALSKKLDSLMVNIQSMNKNLLVQQSEIKELEEKVKEENNELQELTNNSKIDKYFDRLPQFLKDYEKFKKQAEQYNSQVKTYNNQVKTYNNLLDQFSN